MSAADQRGSFLPLLEGHSGRARPAEADGPYRPGYEAVAEQLADYIKQRRMRSGDRLPTEAGLADELGVGRSVVREAVKMLGALGVVDARRGSGLFVGEGTRSFLARLGPAAVTVRPEHISSLLAFRLVQERETAGLAAQRATVHDIRSLDELLQANRVAVVGGAETFRHSDARLHLGIAETSGNLFLVELVDQILRVQSTAIEHIVGGTPGSREAAAAEHASIVAAIRDGDPDEARHAMAGHIHSAERRYDEAVLRLLGRPGALPDEPVVDARPRR